MVVYEEVDAENVDETAYPITRTTVREGIRMKRITRDESVRADESGQGQGYP